MSKLVKENVGSSHFVEEGNFEIEYKITDESFDHAFGTHRQYGFEVVKALYYMEEIGKQVDITSCQGSVSDYVNKLVEADL